jgi:hypothetical protein
MFQMATFRIWVIALVLLVGGPFIVCSTYIANGDIAKLLDHGKKATAEIKKVEWTTKHGIDSNYKLLISFTTESGAAVENKLSVDSEVGKDAKDDKISSIDVKYLPEDTQVVYPADVSGPSNFGYVGGVAMFLAGLGIIVFRLRKKKLVASPASA